VDKNLGQTLCKERVSISFGLKPNPNLMKSHLSKLAATLFFFSFIGLSACNNPGGEAGSEGEHKHEHEHEDGEMHNHEHDSVHHEMDEHENGHNHDGDDSNHEH
jgi:hypothetical protein